MRVVRSLLILAAGASAACARGAPPSVSPPSPTGSSLASRGALSPAAPPQLAAITEADLRRDLFTLASDSFRGREAGTLDELRASVWLADRAREAGLEPAGDDGTYFQFWPMRRTRQSDESDLTIGGTPVALGREATVFTPTNATIDAPIVFVEPGAAIDPATVRGKVAASIISAPPNVPTSGVSLSARRYATVAIRQDAQRLIAAGAVAVVLASDSLAESAFESAGDALMRGQYGLDSAGVRRPAATTPPVIWVRRALADRLRAPNQHFTAHLVVESFVYPSVNVVAKSRGVDARLGSEYVLFSGHQDHDGVRSPIAGDSIWNGADDNASVSVAMLAIARAWTRQPGRRSALFVWHGAEERGLLGSRWYAAHPTVPKSSIVAVLNGDMIGRNTSDSAALLGVEPPHRNSSALVQMALDANARITHFKLDTLWDKPTHPEGWYFRSDHLSYARAGIPALFFTTLLHPDYHTPRDEASRINYPKLVRMTQWMYATGWAVANTEARPGVDPGFKLER